jgi:hypothetical protein
MKIIYKKKSALPWLLLIFFMLRGAVVHAEGGCPPGEIPEGGQGVSSCRPIPGYTQQPQGHWINQWGAIATDTPNHGIGASINQSSEEQAKEAAIANCISNGGVHCNVDITYDNSCVAFVAGDTGHNASSADTVDKAVQLGMNTCMKAGDTNCRAVYKTCSMPKLIQ